MRLRRESAQHASSLRRTTLWVAAAFVGLAVAGLAIAPSLRLLWLMLLVFGIAAVPQAFRRRP